MLSPSRMRKAKRKPFFVREKRLPDRVAFFISAFARLVLPPTHSTHDRLPIASRLRPLVSVLVGLLLCFSTGTDGTRASTDDAAVAHASTLTIALPSVPIRLGAVAPATSFHVARDSARWLVPLCANVFASLPFAANRNAIPAGNTRASSNALALTFPYDATAPPAFLRA